MSRESSIGACCVDQGKLREAQAAYEHAVGIMTQLGHDAQARFYQEEEQFEGKEPAEIEAIKKEFEAESKKRNIALAACLNLRFSNFFSSSWLVFGKP